MKMVWSNNSIFNLVWKYLTRKFNIGETEELKDVETEIGTRLKSEESDKMPHDQQPSSRSTSENLSIKQKGETNERTNLLDESAGQDSPGCASLMRLPLMLLCLYFFVCSLDLLSTSFRLMAGKTAGKQFSYDSTSHNLSLSKGFMRSLLQARYSTTTSSSPTRWWVSWSASSSRSWSRAPPPAPRSSCPWSPAEVGRLTPLTYL